MKTQQRNPLPAEKLRLSLGALVVVGLAGCDLDTPPQTTLVVNETTTAEYGADGTDGGQSSTDAGRPAEGAMGAAADSGVTQPVADHGRVTMPPVIVAVSPQSPTQAGQPQLRGPRATVEGFSEVQARVEEAVQRARDILDEAARCSGYLEQHREQIAQAAPLRRPQEWNFSDDPCEVRQDGWYVEGGRVP